MGHYDECRDGYCGICGQTNGNCEHTQKKNPNLEYLREVFYKRFGREEFEKLMKKNKDKGNDRMLNKKRLEEQLEYGKYLELRTDEELASEIIDDMSVQHWISGVVSTLENLIQPTDVTTQKIIKLLDDYLVKGDYTSEAQKDLVSSIITGGE